MTACGSGGVSAATAGVDDAESVALGIGQHDEVRALVVAIPVDALSYEGHEALDFGCLVGGVAGVEIQVHPRVSCTGDSLSPSDRPGPGLPSAGTSTVQSSAISSTRLVVQR